MFRIRFCFRRNLRSQIGGLFVDSRQPRPGLHLGSAPAVEEIEKRLERMALQLGLRRVLLESDAQLGGRLKRCGRTLALCIGQQPVGTALDCHTCSTRDDERDDETLSILLDARIVHMLSPSLLSPILRRRL